MLLSRDDFRIKVLRRSDGKCVCCGESAVDAHHIIERKLWLDGGYYLDNGAAVCADCHYLAETTEISVEEIRKAAGVKPLLPDHLDPKENYDKWGNVVLSDGRRLPGELFWDPSVQKILSERLHLFDKRVKYPRTYHLPWSPGITSDDRVISKVDFNEVVITEKMDGENTTIYSDYIHARSLTSNRHESRAWVKSLQARIGSDIPEDMRICGENLFATHSIHYSNLPSYFLVFSVWCRDTCLSWDETVEWSELLGLELVPVLYRGAWNEGLRSSLEPPRGEGYVVRGAGSFNLKDFKTNVAKYVRKDHVSTTSDWARRGVVKNIVIENEKEHQRSQ